LHTHLDRHGAHPASCRMGSRSFSGVKWLGCGIGHTPLPSAKVKETVGLYPYSPYVPSWCTTLQIPCELL